MSQFLSVYRRQLNGVGLVVCAVLLGGAYYLEFVSGMEPCPLCVFQRMAFAVLGLGFLLAFMHDAGRIGSAVYATIIALGAGGGAALAIRHLWLQSLPEDEVPACGPGFDYMVDVLPMWTLVQEVLSGSGECAEVDRVLGVTLPAWTLVAFVLLGLLGLGVNLVGRRR